MTRNQIAQTSSAVNEQSATALMAATLAFLRRNKVSKSIVLAAIRRTYDLKGSRVNLRGYRRLVRAYEEMGIVMSTWFSEPRFLNEDCQPLALTIGRGSHSVANLVRCAQVSISNATALELMRRSRSVKFDGHGHVVPLRREFVLPNIEVPRAALVIERYLDTLSRNTSLTKKKTVLLLERNCHVPKVDMRTIAPVLRDIKGRGSAFINSIDGDIEGRRSRNKRNGALGEMSVHIFAWTRNSRSKGTRSKPPVHKH